MSFIKNRDYHFLSFAIFFIVFLSVFLSIFGANQKTQAATTTKTTTEVETFKDADGDGLLDNKDPHPTTAEIYIVEDNNLNGIVDKFEKNN